LNISSLPGGVDNITATYSGDTNFTSGSSTNLAVTVTGLDFTIQTTGPTTIDGNYGDSPQFTFLLSPMTTSSFPGTVQLSATTLSPLHAAFTFSPSSLPINAGPSTVTLSATTSLSQSNEMMRPFRHLAPVSFCLFLPLVMFCRLRSSRHLLMRSLSTLLLIALSIGGAVSLSGCGSGIPAYDYPITITATSGKVSHAVTVTFHVGAVK
jgi:hypothetical protein